MKILHSAKQAIAAADVTDFINKLLISMWVYCGSNIKSKLLCLHEQCFARTNTENGPRLTAGREQCGVLLRRIGSTLTFSSLKQEL